MSFNQFYDKFLYPFEIQEATLSDGQKTFKDDGFSGNQIVIDEGGVNTTVIIGSGLPKTYWYHDDTENVLSDYPQFVTALEDALNNQLTNTYAIQLHTPTNSDIPSCGITISADASFTIRFTDSSFTMDPRLLGFPEGQNSNVDSDGSNDVESPVSYFGAWFPYDDSGENKVIRDHRREPYSIQATSDSRPNAYSIEWQSNQRRRNDYYHLAGPHVFWTRGLESSETDRAGLATNDTNNALEDLWRQSRVLRSDVNSDILIVYGDPVVNFKVAGSAGDGWEIAKLDTQRERTQFFGTVITDIANSSGERYAVNLTTEIKTSNWDF